MDRGPTSPSIPAFRPFRTIEVTTRPRSGEAADFRAVTADQGGKRAARKLMSALGHKRAFPIVRPMSVLPPKADIDHDGGNVRFVPRADVSNRSKKCLYSITSSARANTLGGTSKAECFGSLDVEHGFRISSEPAPGGRLVSRLSGCGRLGGGRPIQRATEERLPDIVRNLGARSTLA
jgi:hypothetical protein